MQAALLSDSVDRSRRKHRRRIAQASVIAGVGKGMQHNMSPGTANGRGRNQLVEHSTVATPISSRPGNAVKVASTVDGEFAAGRVSRDPPALKVVQNGLGPGGAALRWRREFIHGAHAIGAAPDGGAIEIAAGIFHQSAFGPKTLMLGKAISRALGLRPGRYP